MGLKNPPSSPFPHRIAVKPLQLDRRKKEIKGPRWVLWGNRNAIERARSILGEGEKKYVNLSFRKFGHSTGKRLIGRLWEKGGHGKPKRAHSWNGVIACRGRVEAMG